MNFIDYIINAVVVGWIIDLLFFFFFLVYLGGFKVKTIDRLLYPESHGMYRVFKGGGLIFGFMRAGEYGGKFLLIRLFPKKTWRFNRPYPKDIKLSDIRFRQQLPFMAFVILMIIMFLLSGIGLSLRPDGA